jgi:hypothetical protein
MYRMLLQPEERIDENVRVYLLKLFQQAGFKIPNRRNNK